MFCATCLAATLTLTLGGMYTQLSKTVVNSLEKIKGLGGQGEQLKVLGTDLPMDFDVCAPPGVDVHAQPTTSQLPIAFGSFCPYDPEAIQAHLHVWNQFIKPGICQGSDTPPGIMTQLGILHAGCPCYISFIYIMDI